MSLVEENVVFSLVADIRTEVFADYAVPVGSIFLIKFLLNVFGHKILDFEVVNCVLGLDWSRVTSLMASAIMSEPSAISIMFYFLIASVIL